MKTNYLVIPALILLLISSAMAADEKETELNSDIEADLARQIVRNTNGVIDVEDKLTVKKK